MDVADCVVKRKSTGSYEKVSIEYNSDGLLDAVYYQNYGNTEGWLDSHNDKYFHKNGMIIEKVVYYGRVPHLSNYTRDQYQYNSNGKIYKLTCQTKVSGWQEWVYGRQLFMNMTY